MILYEYPFNERVRTYLRLEHLFGRLGQLLPRDSALDHHYALITTFEVMDVTSRADLKSDVLKDLERQKAHMAAFRGNPAISEASLDAILGRLDDAFRQLSAQLVNSAPVVTTFAAVRPMKRWPRPATSAASSGRNTIA